MFARLAAAALCMFLIAAAPAENQAYAVTGSDTFRLGTAERQVAYAGVGRLDVEHVPGGTSFTTHVAYRRTIDGTTTHLTGSYATTVSAGGIAHDGRDGDPDDLTILKQPFAVELDPPTLHDLSLLRTTIPFDFPSPLIGGTLHGALHRLPDALLDGRRVLGIAFSARGPLHGALPERPQLTVTGTISMNGRAYYSYAGALLLGLDATLAIAGTVDGSAGPEPVRLVYRRTFRPLGVSSAE